MSRFSPGLGGWNCGKEITSMLIYVAAAIAIWIAVNVFFVIWMGGGVRRSSRGSVGPGWVPDHPE